MPRRTRSSRSRPRTQFSRCRSSWPRGFSRRERPKETGFPRAWDNVLHDSRSLGYVVATHQTGRDHGPTVFTYYLPLTDEAPAAARAKLLSASWDDLASAVLADLSKAHHDLPDLVSRLDVIRWGHAMARPTPGFLSC